MNIEHLLVPTDLGDAASHAYAHAAAWARAFEARVTILHVDEFMVWTDGAAEFRYKDEYVSFIARHRQAILARFADWGIEAGFEVVRGLPRRQVPAAVGDLAADLVVMPRRSRSRLKWLLLGSTTERVLRTAKVPVLVTVRGIDDTVVPTYGRALLATNLGAESADALRTVQPLLARFDTSAMMLHVARRPETYSHHGWDTPIPVLSQGEIVSEQLLAQRLDRFAAEFGPDVERRLVKGRDPGSEIAQVAASEKIDLIALAASGRSLRRFGSTAARVVQRASAPVLVVPAAR